MPLTKRQKVVLKKNVPSKTKRQAFKTAVRKTPGRVSPTERKVIRKAVSNARVSTTKKEARGVKRVLRRAAKS